MAIDSVMLGILAGQPISYMRRGDAPTLTRHPTDVSVVYSSLSNRYRYEPLYMLDNTARTRSYALGLKKDALKLEDSMYDFAGDNFEKSLAKMEAHSSNPDVARVKITHHNRTGEALPDPVKLDVLQLARPQTNVSTYIEDAKMSLPPNTYSFDVSVNDMKFEFQFVVNENSTNHDFLNKLSRLINSSRVGLSSNVLYDGDLAAIEIKSAAAGIPDNKSKHFDINDENTGKAKGLVSYFGLDQISELPTDAQFSVDGELRTYNSNSFVLDETYTVTLLKADEDGGASTHLNISNSTEALSNNVDKLFGSYNAFMKAAKAYAAGQKGAKRLMSDLSALSSDYRPHLGVYGIKFDAAGTVNVNKEELSAKSSIFGNNNLFPYLEKFASGVYDKSGEIATDPLKYSDRKMVAYKSGAYQFNSAYVTNTYTGMLFDSSF